MYDAREKNNVSASASAVANIATQFLYSNPLKSGN